MPLLRRRQRRTADAATAKPILRRRQRTASFKFSSCGTIEPIIPNAQPTPPPHHHPVPTAFDEDIDDALVAKLGEGARSPCVDINAVRAAQNKLYPLAFIRLFQAQARRKINDEQREQQQQQRQFGLDSYFDDDSNDAVRRFGSMHREPARKRWKRTLSLHQPCAIESSR